MAMGTCSREYKRAVMRNTAAGGNLQNSLDSLEDQKKRLVRSFEEKKLNFIEKKGTLPKLFSSLRQTGGMERSKRGQLTKQLSDSSALNESRERRLKETFKTRLRVPAPYTSLGTQLPLSPLLQRKASRPSKPQLSPLDVAAERQCVSLPASPRFQRRRAESWDQAKSQELRLNDLAEFSSEGPKLRSMSLACEKIESGKQVTLLII